MEKMMKTGIIGAMEEEVSGLKKLMSVSSVDRIADMEFTEGTLDGRDVVVVQCGMGKVNAGICVQTLVLRYGVTRIINTGVGGSLNNEINIGDIVISEDAVQHDFDVSVIGFRKGEIPYTGLEAFPADPDMIQEAEAAAEKTGENFKVFRGRVCSGDQFIASSEQKNRITGTFGGLCAEMEGAAIAQVCYLNLIPYVIIRAISDKADHSEEISFEVFKATAAERCASIVRNMIAMQ